MLTVPSGVSFPTLAGMTTTLRSASLRAPGYTRPADPYVWGPFVGAIGATTFVLVNRGFLPEPWPLVALVAWVLLLVAFVASVVVLPRRFGERALPSPRAGLIYLVSVLAMVGAIALGRRLLAAGDHGNVEGALIAIAVGLHFVPFARAFGAPVFGPLGWVVAGVGAVGLALGLLVAPVWAAVGAVVAGLAMLAILAWDARR